MIQARFTAHFKTEANKHVIDLGHSNVDVSKRLGVIDKSLNLRLCQAKDQQEPVGGDKGILKAAID